MNEVSFLRSERGLALEMKCPFCYFLESKVLDSRPAQEGSVIRRRRECIRCGKRFTTYERVEELLLAVVKKDGRREVFNRHKVLTGLIKACEKRPISRLQLETMVDEIEKELRNTMELEVKSQDIGELVIERLRMLDEVAYVRFASVYREFRDGQSFMLELEKLLKEKDSFRGGREIV